MKVKLEKSLTSKSSVSMNSTGTQGMTVKLGKQ